MGMTPKQTQHAAAIACLLALGGCNSLDGEFLPDCTAFEGDRIVIDGDAYLWDRFTDTREVDAGGNVLEPFPDYPKRGRLVADGDRLSFRDTAGTEIGSWYVHRRGETVALLDPRQHRALQAHGEWPGCPLVRGGDR